MAQVLHNRAPLVFLAVAMVSLSAGIVVARNPTAGVFLVVATLALGGLAFISSYPLPTLFLGWLFLAPLFQEAAEHSSLTVGGPLSLVLYVLPGVALTVLTAVSRNPNVSLTAVDFMPVVFLGYMVVSVVTTSDALQSTPKFVFATVALGPVVYYFLRKGPGSYVPHERIIAVLMMAAMVQGVLSVVEYASGGWNPWLHSDWREGVHAALPRSVGTLANPGVLGMFLGVAIVSAVAILTWDGPRHRRRLAAWTIVACVPGLLATLTRAPILATAVAVLLVLGLGRWRLATVAAVAVAMLLLLAALPTLRESTLYQERIANEQTLSHRGALQEWSLKLAAEKPVFGWGYGSFDEAKNAARFDVQGTNLDLILGFTSHNTYLTALVELGAVGVALLFMPFIVLGAVAFARVGRPMPDRWVVVTALASLVLIVLTATTFDLRFFSFAQVLPWIFLAMLSTALSRQSSPSE